MEIPLRRGLWLLIWTALFARWPARRRRRLAAEIAAGRERVPEFRFIREEAEKRGLRVWLFGGTAAGFSH